VHTDAYAGALKKIICVVKEILHPYVKLIPKCDIFYSVNATTINTRFEKKDMLIYFQI